MALPIIQTLRMPGNPQTFEFAGSDPDYYRLLHDYELPEDLRKPRPMDGVPETVQLHITNSNGVVPFTRELQLWWFYKLNPGLSPHQFEHIIDTWTPGDDSMKVRNCANYVTGERLDMELPKLPVDIAFGGNIVKALARTEWGGGDGLPAGTPVLELGGVDPSYVPSDVNHLTSPHLFHHLTIIRSDGKVNPFPQNGGRDAPPYKPSYKLMMKEYGSKVYVDVRRAVKLESLLIPNPYNPPWLR